MDKEKKKERRGAAIELREVGEGARPVVEGYALVFGTPSDRLPFIETIERGALDGVIERSDVLAVVDHDIRRGVLARCKQGTGSLTLTVDERGLHYSFELPNTELGNTLAENIRRGEITESSFAFTVETDEWTRPDADGQPWRRTIRKIAELFDISPVYTAAYSSTSVDMRGKEEAEDKARRLAEAMAAIDEATKAIDI